MSEPDTDPQKQTMRHIGPVLGIAFVVIIAMFGFIRWIYDETDDPLMPGEAGGTADEIFQEPNPPVEGEAPPE